MKYYIIVLLVALFLILSSCAPANELVGCWDRVEKFTKMEFFNSGVVMWESDDPGTSGMKHYYSIEGDVVSFVMGPESDDDDFIMKYKIDDNKLQLIEEEGDVYRFTRCE